MKSTLAVLLTAISAAAWAQAPIPTPDGLGGSGSSGAGPTIKESEVVTKINSLGDMVRDKISFKEKDRPLVIYGQFKDARLTLENPNASPEERKRALVQLYSLAKGGMPTALNYVGVLLDNGRFVTRDHKAAAKYFYESARRGDLYGKHNYGLALMMGRGATQNVKAGIELLMENSRRRMPYSAVACGIYYETMKEWPAAMGCFTGASGFKEHPIARTRVAMMQLRNRGGAAADYSTIKGSVNQAAKLWWPEAQWAMVDMERYGIGGKSDPFQTAFWLRILSQNPNAKNTTYETSARAAFEELRLEDSAKEALDRSVAIWMQANPNIMPVIDYTKSVAEPLVR